jgi:hypothetical protein
MLAALLLATGCYTRYHQVAGRPFPERIAVGTSGGSVGITQNAQSYSPPGAVVDPARVVARLARRIVEDEVFEPVVYPYTSAIREKPAVVLDATVRIEEKPYAAENAVRAVLHGGSLFLLAPVLPSRSGFVVDLSVTAFLREELEFVGTYSYASEYELQYSALEPSEREMKGWIDETIDHAVEEVLNQLKRDLSGFPTAMAPL